MSINRIERINNDYADMNDATPTPQEWANISANALAEKNREVISEMMSRLESMQEEAASKASSNEREYWRRIFAASAIQSGSSCEDAVAIADEMLKLLCIDGR